MEIKVATTMDELEAVAALRYDVFVHELGYSPRFADPTTRTLLEPVDAFQESTLLYIQEGGKIVASARVEHRIPDWLSYQLTPLPKVFFSLKCCFVSRACAVPSVRGKRRYFDALNLCTADACAKKYELALTAIINPTIMDLFMLYGFHPTEYSVRHPDDKPGDKSTPIFALFACSNLVQGTRLRSFAGRFQHELPHERKTELCRWLKI